jgi:hypothetical protein
MKKRNVVINETATSAALAKPGPPEAVGVATYLDPYEAEKAVGGEA